MNNNENVQKNECSCNTENGKKIVEMLETERKRIVSELHDTSLQNIAHFVHMIELASLYIDKDPSKAKMELKMCIRDSTYCKNYCLHTQSGTGQSSFTSGMTGTYYTHIYLFL